MSIGPLQILLILVIVALIFGTSKLRNLGGDLGSAIKSFKKSLSDSEHGRPPAANDRPADPSSEKKH